MHTHMEAWWKGGIEYQCNSGTNGIYTEKNKIISQPHAIFKSQFQINCELKCEKQNLRTFRRKYVYDLRGEKKILDETQNT